MRTAPARVTIGLLIATSLCWLVVSSAGMTGQAALLAGFVPARLGGFAALPGAVPALATPLTATLLHGGLLHLGLNMLMLGYCGRATEAVIGSTGLALLYLVGAYAAALGQFAVSPGSPVPMIGASGAISAVVGAYAVFHGRRRQIVNHAGLDRLLQVAWLAVGWIAIQLLLAVATRQDGLGIAIAAQIGGFIAGLLLARPLLLWRYRGA